MHLIQLILYNTYHLSLNLGINNTMALKRDIILLYLYFHQL